MEFQQLVRAVQHLAISKSGFVFDPSSGQSFTVNQVGLTMLREMQKEIDETSLMQFVIDHYEGDPQKMERDVEDFLSALIEHLGVQ